MLKKKKNYKFIIGLIIGIINVSNESGNIINDINGTNNTLINGVSKFIS